MLGTEIQCNQQERAGKAWRRSENCVRELTPGGGQSELQAMQDGAELDLNLSVQSHACLSSLDSSRLDFLPMVAWTLAKPAEQIRIRAALPSVAVRGRRKRVAATGEIKSALAPVLKEPTGEKHEKWRHGTVWGLAN